MTELTSQPKILVVEDEQFLRQLYVELLKGEGYQVDEAKDGEEAYEKITQGDFNLILLDFQLPKLDGGQIFAKLKKEAPKKNLKETLVVLTNMEPDFLKNMGLNLEEIKGYIIKSDYTPDQFLNEVKKYLN